MADRVETEGQHWGAALHAFVHLLGQAPAVPRVLKRLGLLGIDPEKWYDINLARTIYYNLAKQVGERTVYQAGFKMVDAARWPLALPDFPAVHDLRSLLRAVEPAYRRVARGPHIGAITVEFDEDHGATMGCTVPLPCALVRGMLQGSVKRFAPTALVEHGEGGCRDHGAVGCTYFVNW